MTNLTIAARFTKSNGQPATSLALSDIKLFLTQQDKSTGVDTTVWDGTQVATAEINNVGMYTRILATADLTIYSYFAMAQYTGATVLDDNYAYGAVGEVEADSSLIWSYTSRTLTSFGTLVADIWANATRTLTSSLDPSAATIVSTLSATLIETGLTFKNAMRAIAASAAGKLSGAATAQVTIRNAVADDKDRIVADVDADGNRTNVVYDFTD